MEGCLFLQIKKLVFENWTNSVKQDLYPTDNRTHNDGCENVVAKWSRKQRTHIYVALCVTWWCVALCYRCSINFVCLCGWAYLIEISGGNNTSGLFDLNSMSWFMRVRFVCVYTQRIFLNEWIDILVCKWRKWCV